MTPLAALVVEDTPDDATLMDLELRRGGFALTFARVESADEMREALRRRRWDLVLSDFHMPRFSAMEALALLKAEGFADDVPFIIVSGSIGENSAVEALVAGAADFISKDNLARLVPAVRRELRDATVRKERREALDSLREALAARDQFLSIASHELKTPLTTLQLQVQGLTRLSTRAIAEGAHPIEPRRALERLGAIERSADRLTALVNRLLDITRLTSGRITLESGELDLVEVTRTVMEELAEYFTAQRTPVSLDAPQPLRGHFDRERIHAVVSNLLSNAAKYGAGHPIEVTVKGHEGAARIVVVDHGIGIDEKDQQRIFERFERAVPEQHFGGFGLGLWLTRLIVEAHGGRIGVASRPGVGSTFTVELPLS